MEEKICKCKKRDKGGSLISLFSWVNVLSLVNHILVVNTLLCTTRCITILIGCCATTTVAAATETTEVVGRATLYALGAELLA